MDAKILRAAVSAAIRVTVSTTLIGCAGNATTDGAGSAGASAAGTGSGGAKHDESANAKSSDGKAVPTYPASYPDTGGTGSSEGGTKGLGGMETAGTANTTGGIASGGVGATAGATMTGESGEASIGGASGEACGSDVDACLTSLEKLDFDDKLSSANKACCKTALDGLKELTADAECYFPLQGRFLSMPAHQQCCMALNAWQQQACTPWGPPVPPELSLHVLLEWEAAA